MTAVERPPKCRSKPVWYEKQVFNARHTTTLDTQVRHETSIKKVNGIRKALYM